MNSKQHKLQGQLDTFCTSIIEVIGNKNYELISALIITQTQTDCKHFTVNQWGAFCCLFVILSEHTVINT